MFIFNCAIDSDGNDAAAVDEIPGTGTRLKRLTSLRVLRTCLCYVRISVLFYLPKRRILLPRSRDGYTVDNT